MGYATLDAMETNETSRTNLLDDTAESTGGCCGGGGCMCGHGAESAEATTASSTAASSTTASSTTESAAATEFLVTGMTCGHCVASVTEEVGAVTGVDAVAVELNKGGASRVTVRSAGPIDEAAIRAAVEEAGYQLA